MRRWCWCLFLHSGGVDLHPQRRDRSVFRKCEKGDLKGDKLSTNNHHKSRTRSGRVEAEQCETEEAGTKKCSKKLRETDDETKGSNKIQKTMHARIAEAHESTRNRLESTLQKIMKSTL